MSLSTRLKRKVRLAELLDNYIEANIQDISECFFNGDYAEMESLETDIKALLAERKEAREVFSRVIGGAA